MSAQTILTPNGERLVVLPEADYDALVEAAEDADDLKAFAKLQRKLDTGEEELIPLAVVDRILAGDNRVKVWREHRALTSSALAERAEIGQGFLSQIETGKREGTAETLLRIAGVLRVSVEDLIEPKIVRIERLIHRRPGLTVAQLADESNSSAGHAKKHSDWLCRVGRATKKGRPARFYPPPEVDIET